MPTLVIMAGGTGGHIFPALAVASRARIEGWSVLWIGAYGGMEEELVQRNGYPIVLLDMQGIRGKSLLTLFSLPRKVLVSFARLLKFFLQKKPDVVLGMGGYASFVGGVVTWMLRRPLVIHESNAIPGATNRFLAPLAKKVLVGFSDSIKGGYVVGNPVDEKFSAFGDPEERYTKRSGKLKILVVGGSRGARFFNDIVPAAISMISADQRPLVTHQAGMNNLNLLRENYDKHGVHGDLVEFIYDMPQLYSDVDLVIARAGAMTVTEISRIGVASLLIPYPFAVDDHQMKNAERLELAGASVVMRQDLASAEQLSSAIEKFSRDDLLRMAKRAHSLFPVDATEKVFEELVKVAT
jgi:UDP-N-acetylglucosamine--N-acetylmuramyl-(pentapeptide) pyrophosphoryl-undecaprenol N-acetylglucosamine transferase